MGPAAASLSLRERAGNDSCQSAETPCGCKRLRVLGFRVSGFGVSGFWVLGFGVQSFRLLGFGVQSFRVSGFWV